MIKRAAKFTTDIVKDPKLGPLCGLIVLGSIVYAAGRFVDSMDFEVESD